MRTVIVGAGPTGLFTAIALARRGHRAVVVDRDPGPPRFGDWRRKGVMQFHHAHTFRSHVVEALDREMPEVLDRLVAAGATVTRHVDGSASALLCRRSVVEQMLRAAAAREPDVRLVTGHAGVPVLDRDRVIGVTVGGHTLAADLVVDASGRSGRFAAARRPVAEISECGAVYVTRQYRIRPGVTDLPVDSPLGLSLNLPGYLAIAFLHDDHTFSVTLIHDGSDDRLRSLRATATFDVVVRTIPLLREWVEPAHSQPISPPLPGGRLYNSYRGQVVDPAAAAGLVAVGDAVCSTTPLAARGVALAFMQAGELIAALDHSVSDLASVATHFDSWCENHIKPWFVDHRHSDGDRVRRWSGEDIDVRSPLPSDLVVAAAQVDPQLRRLVEPFSRMTALPASLAPAAARARAVYAAGWRPDVAPGPTRGEVAELCAAADYGAA